MPLMPVQCTLLQCIFFNLLTIFFRAFRVPSDSQYRFADNGSVYDVSDKSIHSVGKRLSDLKKKIVWITFTSMVRCRITVWQCLFTLERDKKTIKSADQLLRLMHASRDNLFGEENSNKKNPYFRTDEFFSDVCGSRAEIELNILEEGTTFITVTEPGGLV